LLCSVEVKAVFYLTLTVKKYKVGEIEMESNRQINQRPTLQQSYDKITPTRLEKAVPKSLGQIRGCFC
jgi:hypothetical protein